MDKIVKYVPVILLIAIGLFFLFSEFLKMKVYEGYNDAKTQYAEDVANGTAGTTKTVTTPSPSSGFGSKNINDGYGSNGIATIGYDGNGYAILSYDSTNGKPIIGYNGNSPIYGIIASPILPRFNPNQGLLSEDKSQGNINTSPTISDTSPTDNRPNSYGGRF